MTATDRIENYISGIELDNLQLTIELRAEKDRVQHLLKWIYLSGGSRVLLEMIKPDTIEFCFVNKYPIDSAYKVQIELTEVRSWLTDLNIEMELTTKDDVINARAEINRAISSRNSKS